MLTYTFSRSRNKLAQKTTKITFAWNLAHVWTRLLSLTLITKTINELPTSTIVLRKIDLQETHARDSLILVVSDRRFLLLIQKNLTFHELELDF